MAARSKSTKHNDIVKMEMTYNRGKYSKKKTSPSFVPLNGLSQSAKDRMMNNRTVRRPKNLNLVEGEPEDAMEFKRKLRELKSFPNENLLSSKIKEVNGMDFSNHFIEQHYRHCHLRSDSPEISEDSTNSSSITNNSVPSRFQKEACISNTNSSTGIESSTTESDLPADSSDATHQEYICDNQNYDSHFVDAIKMKDFICNSRFSKNAAIIGLLKKNIISLADLELEDAYKKIYYSEDDFQDMQYTPHHKNGEIVKDEISKNNSVQKFDSKSTLITEYPFLVPHPDDPEFFTHPLQAYGKIDDTGIDFRLPRIGEKTVMTSRQYFIREGLNDEKFTFQKQITTDPSKPKSNINLPKIDRPRSSYKQNHYDSEPLVSYNALVNDKNGRFIFNREEFPTLQM